MAKVISLNRRTKKGRTAAEQRAIEVDRKVTDVKHLQGRIMSLTQVIAGLMLLRDKPEDPVVFRKEELVTLNPDDVTIIVNPDARDNAQGLRDANVTVRLKLDE